MGLRLAARLGQRGRLRRRRDESFKRPGPSLFISLNQAQAQSLTTLHRILEPGPAWLSGYNDKPRAQDELHKKKKKAKTCVWQSCRDELLSCALVPWEVGISVQMGRRRQATDGRVGASSAAEMDDGEGVSSVAAMGDARLIQRGAAVAAGEDLGESTTLAGAKDGGGAGSG